MERTADMVATYEIKRNTLSSRWGVWAAEEGGNAPVENLLGEFKTRVEAETFREHVNAGQTPQAALAALEEMARAEKAGGKSIFGKFRKRGGEAAVPVKTQKQPSNQVIQIQKHQDEPAPQEEVADVMEASFESPAPQERSPFRYEPVKKAAAAPVSRNMPPVAEVQQQPVPAPAEDEADELAEAEAASAEEEVAVADAVIEPEQVAAAEQEEPETVMPQPQAVADDEPQPQAEATIGVDENVPGQKTVRMISRVKARDISAPAPEVAQEQQPADDDDDKSGLVNWTFTPPPDISAEEVKPRRKAAQKEKPVQPPVAIAEPAEDREIEALEAEQPAALDVQPAPAASVSKAVASNSPAPQPQQVIQQSGPARSADSGKVTIDICTARSLQNEAWGDPNIPDKKYSSIVSKEYTEVSKAMSNGASPEHLREELVHLASVCISWADAIDKRLASQQEKAA